MLTRASRARSDYYSLSARTYYLASRVVLLAVRQNTVNQTVFYRFFRGHKAIALGIAFDLLQ